MINFVFMIFTCDINRHILLMTKLKKWFKFWIRMSKSDSSSLRIEEKMFELILHIWNPAPWLAQTHFFHREKTNARLLRKREIVKNPKNPKRIKRNISKWTKNLWFEEKLNRKHPVMGLFDKLFGTQRQKKPNFEHVKEPVLLFLLN